MAFLLAFPSLLREHYRDSTLVRRCLVDLDRGPSEHSRHNEQVAGIQSLDLTSEEVISRREMLSSRSSRIGDA
jgi:hypothetical protein